MQLSSLCFDFGPLLASGSTLKDFPFVVFPKKKEKKQEEEKLTLSLPHSALGLAHSFWSGLLLLTHRACVCPPTLRPPLFLSLGAIFSFSF